MLIIEDYLLPIIDIARLAPSVHNTQPWQVTAKGNQITILTDSKYSLKDGDPTGRQTVISKGIFIEAIVIAAKNMGFKCSGIVYKNETARLSFAPMSGDSKVPNDDVRSLKARFSDRSIYAKIDVKEKFVKHIEKLSPNSGTKVWCITDTEIINKVAKLTAQGIGMAMSSPQFRQELSEYLVRKHSKNRRGIAVPSLYLPLYATLLEPWLVRFGFGIDKEKTLEEKRWRSASALILITSVGDSPGYWFNVGRAYLRASLVIEKSGFSQSTSASTVEASTFHEDVEALLGTQQRLQCVMRIGQGSSTKNYSPRVEAKDLITSS